MAEQKMNQQPEQDLSQQTKVRREKLAALQAEGQDPFRETRFDWDVTSQQIKDNLDAMEGKAVKVPTAYFKALLGYKKNGTISITASTGGYTGIAFYYPHEAYSGSWQSKAMSIDELEAKVGEDFFVNLPLKIGADRAAKVESYFSSSDTLWK